MTARTLVAAALLVLAPAARPADDPPVVVEVSLELPPGEDPAPLQGLLWVRPGEPLSLRALRRTVQLLYQLGRFSNVVAREVTLPPRPGEPRRVRLVLHCLPRRVAGTVRLSGAGDGPVGLGETWARRASGLREGEELAPGRLESAAETLRSAYARRGWRQARVEVRAEGEPVAAVEIAVNAGPPTRISEVKLGARPGLDAEMGKGLHSRPGAVLDLDAIEEDVRTLRAELRGRAFYRATVGPPEVTVRGEEASVDFAVRTGPHLDFRFVGATAFSDAELRGRLGYDPEQPLDAAAVDAAAERLRTFLEERGFLRARVAAEEVGDSWERRVLFHVEEGRRYRLGEVRFRGQSFRDEPWLRARLRELLGEEVPEETVPDRVRLERLAASGGTSSPGPSRWTGPTDPREVYDEPRWKRALDRLVEGYRSDGFLTAAGENVRLELDGRSGVVDVEIRLKEGVRTFVDSISFEGNREVPLPDLARQAKLAPGDPLSATRAEETRQAILELYARRGFLYARVDVGEEYAPDRRSAALRYRVEEGPRVRVGSILVMGNRRTRASVIRGALDVGPGDVYAPEAATASQTALLGLGVFRSADLRLSDPETAEAVKDVTVEVSERPWQTLTAGLGISVAEGPRAFVEYGQPNLFGRALEFVARGKANFPLVTLRPDLIDRPARDRLEGSVILGLRWPQPARLPVAALRLDVIAEHRLQSAYDLTRGAMALGLELARLGRFSASVTYDLELDWVSTPTGYGSVFQFAPPEEARLISPPGLTTLHALRPSVSLDHRDNAALPRKGWFLGAAAEVAHSLGSPGKSALFGLLPGSDTHINMAKITGTASAYLPVGPSVFAAQFRVGRVYPFDGRSITIAPKRFYLGGATTMRGYGEFEMIPEDRRATAIEQTERCATLVTGLGCSKELRRRINAGVMLPSEGGEAFLLVKGELRVPLGRSLEAGFFADIGNLWLDTQQASLRAQRLNLGLGLRVVTPVGPAAIDVGFNVQPEPRLNEPVMAAHFSVGYF